MKLKTLNAFGIAAAMTCGVALAGCGDKSGPQAKAPPAAAGDDHAHADGHAHADDHAHAGGHDHHGGAVIDLGSAQIGQFTVKATRDDDKIVAGKEAAIDATITASGSTKAVAVRFWIGTEDGKGSAKAKADIEDPKEPNRWHTHAEVPNPIPAGSMLWVEIENDKGETAKGSFGLKQ